jgi:hypothetical protein
MELLLVDGASEDETKTILERLAEDDPHPSTRQPGTEFSTMVGGLLVLRDWLNAHQSSHLEA